MIKLQTINQFVAKICTKYRKVWAIKNRAKIYYQWEEHSCLIYLIQIYGLQYTVDYHYNTQYMYKYDQIKEVLTSLSLFNALLPTADTVSFD